MEDKGQPWKSSFQGWQVQLSPSLDSKKWATPAGTDTSIIGKTITQLVAISSLSKPDYISHKFQDLIDKYGIAVLNHAITKGIKQAGVYDLLKLPSCDFTHNTLSAAANHHIVDENSQKAGVHVSLRKRNSDVALWKQNTTYCYTGKSVSFGERFEDHTPGQSKHANLIRRSQVRTCALCIRGCCRPDETIPTGSPLYGINRVQLGRLCCLWTANSRAILNFESSNTDTYSSQQTHFSKLASGALLYQQRADIPENLQSSSHNLRILENSAHLDDDASDGEDENEDDGDFDSDAASEDE
ncbi:hypothetical protein CC86DRAFT_384163 [Ophiobolus disseminans]|uniref:Uncharacterized protein n=1 Tax=Ophiobolus disseminans TaxID=1469910 RepID=A0A6A6ZVQ9_9PLEO|nr:hypothetical protein CC86DRAFT_384163 [Ophiobolus disseminans]